MSENAGCVWDKDTEWILQWDRVLHIRQPNSRHLDEDEVDRVGVSSARKTNSIKRAVSTTKSLPQTPGGGGGMDEEGFLRAFEDVPQVQIFSARDLDDSFNKIRQIISDPSAEWNKRVDALKKIRGLLIAGAANYDELYNHLRLLDPPFQTSVKDLRSQVVREACVTIAFMSQQLGHRLEHFAESLIPVLFNLIQNSAKVIASAGQVCIGFVVAHTESGRLVPYLVAPLNSKSRDIRRAAVRLLHQALNQWPTSILTRHSALLQQGVAQAIADADQDVRMTARKAYWAFKNHFPDQAEQLLNSLDANYKRSLHSDMSNSSSSNSLHQPLSRPKLTELTPSTRRGGSSMASPARTPSARSNSAIDLQAAQRAKARAQYAAMARQKVGSNASLPRPKKTVVDSGPSSLVSPERTGRQRSRIAGVSQSQPSSRSGSPSSRLNYATYGGGGERSRRSPSYSRSTTGSRETSPCRYTPLPPLSKLRSRSGSGQSVERPQLQQTARPVMAQRILQQSLEAENALADALTYEVREPSVLMSPRRLRGLVDDHSDDSETSSVCSERSFESHRRTSDSYSWSGSQQRLYRDMWEPTIKDINEILGACESTHWSERKDGLVSLSMYLQAGHPLSPHQLTRITDNFTKMLSDSHTKVFSLFLDTVNDLIVSHHGDLNSWLYILLTRLFNKLGGDLLGSIQTKIHKTLQVVRENFGSEAVLQWALRFLVDGTQTPNTRVKLTVLQFIARLAPSADPSTAFPPPLPGSSKDITTLALTKMIGWTMGDGIKQGIELRRGAQEAVLALFNLNTPQVTLRFAQLPKEYQEAAAALIQGRVRKSSLGPGDSPSKQQDLSPDQVYRSLRRTTAEIQSYSYDGKVADTASHDSGISQMSINDKSDIDLITNWTGSMSLSSPTRHTGKDCNGIDSTTDNGFSIENGGEESGAFGRVLDTLESGNSSHHKQALTQLAKLVKETNCLAVTNHFKRLLRVLLSELGSSDVESRALVLTALCEMMKKRSLGQRFQSYVELVVLKVVQAYSDPNKEVVRCAELCAGAIASVLQSDLVIKVLTPLISMEEFPVNLAAIKTLTKLVEARPKEDILPFLPELMPGLVQAYGNDESLVRKAAVFCMVALHRSVGPETLKPYLASLNASKLKLLHLYINRTHNGASPTKPTPTTPDTTSNTPS